MGVRLLSGTLFLCVAAFPAKSTATEDIFDALTGNWGYAAAPTLRCKENPHSLTFSDDRSRASLHWARPYPFMNEASVTEMRFRVLSHDGESVTMVREDRPVVAIGVTIFRLRYFAEQDAYCWVLSNVNADKCSLAQVRCDIAHIS